jgi:Lrp/AsnC family leucine-responsive transcriptional regulator
MHWNDSGEAMAQFDSIDRKLLSLLQKHDRLALAELSKAIGAPASTLNDRINRLVAHGVITGFHARVAPEALGLELLAFVFVGWSDPKVEPVFLKRIESAPAVLECHHITGAWNYVLKVRVPTTRDFEKFLAEMVKAVHGVQRTETMIALSSAKETWAVDMAR